VLETQEKERRAIALELHDDVGQDLAALNLLQRSMLHAPSAASAAEDAAKLADCVAITQSIYDRIGDIALKLRPSVLDRLGFLAALNWYIRQAAKRSNCEISLTTASVPDDLPEAVSVAAFRIVQEAVSNAMRHAGARCIDVLVSCEDRCFRVCVIDDGAGFDVQAVEHDTDPFAGFGLLGMKERARITGGSLTLQSSIGGGTRVEAEFPLSADPAHASAGAFPLAAQERGHPFPSRAPA
jgi:signal transduction histidine kinase